MLTKFNPLKPEILLPLLGLLLGTAYLFFPLKYLILITAGLLGIILIMWKIEIGIVAVAMFLPFLPTTAVAVLSLLLVLSFAVRLLAKKDIQLKSNPLNLWILLFGGLVAFFAITSVTVVSSVKVAVVMLAYMALYFVTINTVRNKQILYLVIVALCLSAFAESVYGIYQYNTGVLTISENWTDTELFPDVKTRVFGTLDNPNILAQYLEFTIPLALAMIWGVRSFSKKMLFLGLASVMVVCLVYTLSRGGWLALALSLIVFGILRDRKVLLILGIAGLLSINFLPDVFIDRIASIGNLSESSNSYRAFIWKSSADMVKDFWFSGVGLGAEAFGKLFNTFYNREGVYALHTHNLYIQILVEMGILGLLLFFSVVFMTFRYGLSALVGTDDTFIKSVIAGLLAGIIGFLVHGVSENSFYNFKIVFMFWFVISLVMAARGIKGESDDQCSACHK